MTNFSGRHLACLVLDQVENENAYVNLALQETLSRYNNIDQREKAFCTELVYGTMRHLLKIDYFLGRLLSRPLKSLKVTVKNTLRISLYQLLYLPEIPARAVCHSAVAMIKGSKYQGLAPLVNGVLRSFLREQPQLPDPERERIEYLAIEYSHPQWLIARWLAVFGDQLTEKILQVNNQKPPLTVRITAHDYKAVTDLLAQEGVEWEPGLWLDEAINLTKLPGALEDLRVFQSGKIFVQDESSMLVSRLLKPTPGELIVDLCAAPGGKSTHLAELMDDQGVIYSIDDHQHKIDLITANARRLALSSIKPTLGDARKFTLPDTQLADAVLVDAPCSGTGVLRRRVDARYRKKLEDLQELVELQRSILKNAAGLVKPDGRLVYSTCSIEPEEDEEQVKWFLEQYSQFEIEAYQQFLTPKISSSLLDPNLPWVKVIPSLTGGDGFFICRFKRRQ